MDVGSIKKATNSVGESSVATNCRMMMVQSQRKHGVEKVNRVKCDELNLIILRIIAISSVQHFHVTIDTPKTCKFYVSWDKAIPVGFVHTLCRPVLEFCSVCPYSWPRIGVNVFGEGFMEKPSL